MKAISLWQPWASLMASGAKKIETRSWPTKYRGQLVICSAKKIIPEGIKGSLAGQCLRIALQRLEGKRFDEGLVRQLVFDHPMVKIHSWPYGYALAIGNLIDCIPTEEAVKMKLDPYELIFGDYTSGRFAWIFSGMEPVERPFPIIGRQRLFKIEAARDS